MVLVCMEYAFGRVLNPLGVQYDEYMSARTYPLIEEGRELRR